MRTSPLDDYGVRRKLDPGGMATGYSAHIDALGGG